MFLASAAAQAGELETCKQLMTRLDRSRNLVLISNCQDFYFLNPDHESPRGSFNNAVRLGYRYLAIDPHDVTQYGNTSWLLWSKWMNWKRDPSTMPDGEDKLDAAVRLLLQGRVYNPTNAAFHFEAGNSFGTMTRAYSPELAPLAIESFELADRHLPAVNSMKIRARIEVGHLHYWKQDFEAAKAAYYRVLEIDPQNHVARKTLERLGETPAP
jgi:tetratricopeptide (TPR) repeat protein